MVHQRKNSVIGLGYVGLPVAISFGKSCPVIGFDINPNRVSDLKNGLDITQEFSSEEIKLADVHFSSDKAILAQADFYIICVPTPSDGTHKPNLSFLYKACEILGPFLKKNDIVVFESTVYPGATQEECIPVLERFASIKAGVDFWVGYSPERINPGDKKHAFSDVVKIVAGLDADTTQMIAQVYGTVVKAGIYRAPNIKVAEAAKVIENTQRDLNIALMNELAIICERMNIDTHEVINAAKTKWNFLPFVPGLVGGHCIGVDPYYLSYKAKQLGYRPEVILAGRRINDGMGKYVADQAVKQMILKGTPVKGAQVAVLGLTFKENCRDIRNTKVIDVINELQSFGIKVIVHDPIADKDEAYKEYELELTDWEDIYDVDAIILCVSHLYYKELSAESYAEKFDNNRLIIDVKGIFDKEAFSQVDIDIWRL
ncbi:MAG: nucleotide sugar dehydrogenase [Candidatus Berkiella sp.]